MITRIELDGFKTFQKFALDLSPLQVIVGLNGAGKSNLFDALQLLSKLAESDLRSAFQNMRGEAGELFTIGPDSRPLNRLHMAVEVLVNRTVADDWGAVEELRYPRMRYELEVVRQPDRVGLDRLYVAHESLASIPRGEDQWTRRFDLQTGGNWIPKLTGGRKPFISTKEEQGKATLSLHQDGRSGRRNIVAEQAERTVLSGVLNTEFPHAFAVAQEIRSWRFLQINPEVLRSPSPMTAPKTMAADGRYLANVLARMKATDETLLADVSRDLSNMVSGILRIDVEADPARDQYVIWADMEDGRRFSSRVLSDGTLRMLALITLKNDPEHAGVLCFEEPENGVHPGRLAGMAALLQELVTDFNEPEEAALPLRQVLCNTHSPAFISYEDILPNVLFAYITSRIDPARAHVQRVTRIVPLQADSMQLPLFEVSLEERAYTLSEVRAYLESGNLDEALRNLAPAQLNGTVPPGR
jgi:predicted ATPase